MMQKANGFKKPNSQPEEILLGTYSFTVKAARLIGQCSLEDLVDPRLLRLLSSIPVSSSPSSSSALAAPSCATSSTILHQLSVLLPLLALLLLEQVGDGVEEVVEEFVGILLHVVVKKL